MLKEIQDINYRFSAVNKIDVQFSTFYCFNNRTIFIDSLRRRNLLSEQFCCELKL